MSFKLRLFISGVETPAGHTGLSRTVDLELPLNAFPGFTVLEREVRELQDENATLRAQRLLAQRELYKVNDEVRDLKRQLAGRRWWHR